MLPRIASNVRHDTLRLDWESVRNAVVNHPFDLLDSSDHARYDGSGYRQSKPEVLRVRHRAASLRPVEPHWVRWSRVPSRRVVSLNGQDRHFT
ncbi:hypothetical protein J2S53_000064 [Actinopolyspora lacussalsi]|nr:hypothetical protein [Actinopolyspora lacussalsi]